MKKLTFFTAIFFVMAMAAPTAIAQENEDMMDEEGEIYAADKTAKVAAGQSEEYGWYLMDSTGRTLYIFLGDKNSEGSSCYGKCAEVWPPFTGNPKAIVPMVDEDLLGVVERRDGSMQVTYNGWPLYYYVEDQYTGEFTGQDVKGFGAEWYMISPDGTIIHEEHEEKEHKNKMDHEEYMEDDY